MAALRNTGRLTIPDLRRNIAGINEGPFMAKLSTVLSAAAFKLTMDTFKTSTDPYGKPWAKLKSRRGMALLDTGRMRASIFFNPLPRGFRVDFSVPYAAHHQYGTKKRAQRVRSGRDRRSGRFRSRRGGLGGLIPQRQMIPMEETGGLPAKWVDVFNRETVALIARAMRVA